jgi:opacity protein-like surface antigen
MKTNVKIALTACIAALLFTLPNRSFAQVEDLGVIMQGGVTDANTLLQKYMNPLGAGFGAGLNTGWINSATPHKFLGFHIKVGAAVVPIPAAERYFTLQPDELTTLSIGNAGIGRSPTIVGNENEPTYLMRYVTTVDPDQGGPIPPQNIELASFTLPKGVITNDLEYEDQAAVAAPVIQIGLGLGSGSEIMLRYVPETELEAYGTVSQIGAGLKYSLTAAMASQDEETPSPFDLSVVGAYTNFNYNVPLSLPDPANNTTVPGQELEWATTAWNANLVAGLTPRSGWFRHIFEPSIYAGIGYEQATTDMNMLGRYGYKVVTPLGQDVEYVDDPIAIKMDSPNSIRYIAGLRLRVLSLVFANVEYTHSTYSTFSVGLGIAIR